MRRLALAALTALVALTATTAFAGKPAKPAPEPALGGYCPVAYVAMGQAMKGDATHSVTRGKQTYRFANADAKRMFLADPGKYAVGYDGWCATAMGMGQKMKSDPTLFSVHAGVTYLFSSAEAKKMFDADPAAHVGRGDAGWAKLGRK